MSRRDLLPGVGPVLTLKQALYRACRDYRGGMNAVSIMTGIDYDALSKALNPNDDRPIRPEWIEDILSVTRDARLIAALVRPAGALGFVPTPVPANNQALRALASVCRAKGEFIESIHGATADGRWEAHEVAQLKYHANELISSILGIVAGAELAMEGQIDG